MNNNELLDKFLNILSNNPLATNILIELKKQGLKYSDRMFDMIWEHRHRLTAFESILKVYSPSEPTTIQLSQHTVTIGSVLLKTLIQKNWFEGVAALLNHSPDLINTIIFPSLQISHYSSALVFALNSASEDDRRILKLLIEKSQFIDLVGYKGSTVFHHFAKSTLLCTRHAQQLDHLLRSATPEMMNQKNDDGLTPLTIASIEKNQAFIACAKKYLSEVVNDSFPNISSSTINLNDKKSAEQLINAAFSPCYPQMNPVLMMLTLLAHRQDKMNSPSLLRLYFNANFLRIDLNTLLEKGVRKFSLIGNLQLKTNHSLTIYLQLGEDNCLKLRIFESASNSLFFDMDTFAFLKNVANRFHLSLSILFLEDIKFVMPSGCRVQSCFISGNLLSMDASELTSLPDKMTPYVASLPLKTGILSVCASLSTIKTALRLVVASDDEKKQFKIKLHPCLQNEFDPRFFGVEHKVQNHSLKFEIQNQKEFTLKGLESATYEKLADLICLPPERSKLVEFIFESNLSWLHWAQLNCYEDLLFSNDLLLKNHQQYLHYFIDSNVNLNHQNSQGNTLLMLAVDSHKLELVRTLLNLGVDPHVKNNNKKTALDIATHMTYPDPELISVLQNYSNASTGALKRFSQQPNTPPTIMALSNQMDSTLKISGGID